jgi:large subunit ribosomal protein L5
MNPMRKIRVEKVTLHINTGEPGERLEKALTLLERIANQKPVVCKAKRRIREWGIRPGLPIGAKVTLRGKKALELLQRLLKAVNFKLREEQIDDSGNLSFGIDEYIKIPGVKYDPKIGIFGMDVIITLERPGYRVKRRRLKKSKVGKRHLITKQEAKEFYEKELGITFV